MVPNSYTSTGTPVLRYSTDTVQRGSIPDTQLYGIVPVQVLRYGTYPGTATGTVHVPSVHAYSSTTGTAYWYSSTGTGLTVLRYS